MKVKRIYSIWAVLIMLLTSNVKGGDFHIAYLPEGVRLGASLVDITSVRSGLVQNNFPHPDNRFGGVTSEFIELQKAKSPPLAYFYRFKDDKLGSVLRSSSMRSLSVHDAKLAAVKIYNDLNANFRMTREDAIVRSNGTTTIIATAQLWQGDDAQFSLYFVATTDELTLVIFDPTQCERSNFFLGVERLPDVNSTVEKVKTLSIGRAKDASPTLADLIPDIHNSISK